jgi:hypothetical protein
MMADQRYHGHVGGAVIHALCLSSSMVIAKERSRTLHADLSSAAMDEEIQLPSLSNCCAQQYASHLGHRSLRKFLGKMAEASENLSTKR